MADLPDHWGQREDESARMAFTTWMETADRAGSDMAGERVETASLRLGHRFERNIQAWLTFHSDWTVLAANHVIQLGKRTAGEIDLIIHNEEACVHLELAVKFYLSSAGSSQWETWQGIDPVDRLDLKLAKFQQQLRLSEDAAVAHILEEQGLHITERRAWMKGWFFEHYSRIARPVLPKNASPTCQVGWWCHESDWEQIWSSAGQWVLLDPAHWLRVRHDPTDVHLLNTNPSLPQGKRKSNAWMVVQVEDEGDTFREINRGVVVKNHWPEV